MLKSKNFKCFKSYDPAYLFKKNKISIQSNNCKNPKWLAIGRILSFFCLIIFNSSNSIRSFDRTTVE